MNNKTQQTILKIIGVLFFLSIIGFILFYYLIGIGFNNAIVKTAGTIKEIEERNKESNIPFIDTFQCRISSTNQNNRLILYLGDRLDSEECGFLLRSNYLDDKIFDKQISLTDRNVYVKMAPGLDTHELFFSLENEKEINRITVLHRNWIEQSGNELISNKYSVSLDSIIHLQDENCYKLSIRNFIFVIPEIGKMDAVLFFTDKRGFIGSYMIGDFDRSLLVNKEGDILEDHLSYKGYSFGKI